MALVAVGPDCCGREEGEQFHLVEAENKKDNTKEQSSKLTLFLPGIELDLLHSLEQNRTHLIHFLHDGGDGDCDDSDGGVNSRIT